MARTKRRVNCPECGAVLGKNDETICRACFEKAGRALADILTFKEADKIVDLAIRLEFSRNARRYL
jgi:hypothetical protein